MEYTRNRSNLFSISFPTSAIRAETLLFPYNAVSRVLKGAYVYVFPPASRRLAAASRDPASLRRGSRLGVTVVGQKRTLPNRRISFLPWTLPSVSTVVETGREHRLLDSRFRATSIWQFRTLGRKGSGNSLTNFLKRIIGKWAIETVRGDVSLLRNIVSFYRYVDLTAWAWIACEKNLRCLNILNKGIKIKFEIEVGHI